MFEQIFIKSKGQPVMYNDREIFMLDKISLDNS